MDNNFELFEAQRVEEIKVNFHIYIIWHRTQQCRYLLTQYHISRRFSSSCTYATQCLQRCVGTSRERRRNTRPCCEDMNVELTVTPCHGYIVDEEFLPNPQTDPRMMQNRKFWRNSFAVNCTTTVGRWRCWHRRCCTSAG